MYTTFEKYFKYVKNPNIEDIKKIIELDKDYNYGLFWACMAGNLEIVQYLIDNGANNYDDALYSACQGGNLEVFNLILSKKSVFMGAMTFECACQGGNLEIIDIIINRGPNSWEYGLRGACRGGHMIVIDIMIEKMRNNWTIGNKMANPENEETIFIWNYGLEGACEGGQLEIVKLMISKGANDWDKGLHCATYNYWYSPFIKNRPEIVKLMISKGSRNYRSLEYSHNPSMFKLYMKYSGNYDILKYEKLVIEYDSLYCLMIYKNVSKLSALPMDLIRLLMEFIN